MSEEQWTQYQLFVFGTCCTFLGIFTAIGLLWVLGGLK